MRAESEVLSPVIALVFIDMINITVRVEEESMHAYFSVLSMSSQIANSIKMPFVLLNQF